MRRKTFYLFCALGASVSLGGARAQVDIVASGGDAVGVNGASASHSLGVVVYTSIGDGDYRIQQGVQHAFPGIIVPPGEVITGTGFSPDGDGVNDAFVIPGIEEFPNSKLIIYNRWGNEVFSASPYENDWEGVNQAGKVLGSDELPDGTYFYVLDLGDGRPIIKNYLQIER